jgi:hypothetical protein
MTTTPATARTDVRAGAGPSPAGIGTGAVRGLGAALAVGAIAYAATFVVIGNDADGLGGRIGDLFGFGFQLGVFALLAVMARTGAIGSTRTARVMLRVEYVLLAVASVWSVLHALVPTAVQDDVWLGVLDLFWPLSMLGMFVIGIKVAVAGRWRGVLRVWPLLAETWAPATIPVYFLVGGITASWIGAVHMILGYGVLGLLLVMYPRLTGAR